MREAPCFLNNVLRGKLLGNIGLGIYGKRDTLCAKTNLSSLSQKQRLKICQGQVLLMINHMSPLLLKAPSKTGIRPSILRC